MIGFDICGRCFKSLQRHKVLLAAAPQGESLYFCEKKDAETCRPLVDELRLSECALSRKFDKRTKEGKRDYQSALERRERRLSAFTAYANGTMFMLVENNLQLMVAIRRAHWRTKRCLKSRLPEFTELYMLGLAAPFVYDYP